MYADQISYPVRQKWMCCATGFRSNDSQIADGLALSRGTAVVSLTQPEGFVARNAYYSTMDVASNACTAANSAAYSWFNTRSYFPSVYDR